MGDDDFFNLIKWTYIRSSISCRATRIGCHKFLPLDFGNPVDVTEYQVVKGYNERFQVLRLYISECITRYLVEHLGIRDLSCMVQGYLTFVDSRSTFAGIQL